MPRRRIPLRDLIPGGPVLSARRRRRLVEGPRSSGATPAGPPVVPFPVLPLQVFGVSYDLDLVLVTDHPDWDMHEYARVATADGPVWLCKDSRAGTLEQSIVADVDGLAHWLPEVPLQRRRERVEVVDRSAGEDLDVLLSYTNLDGDPVEVHYQGPAPRGPVRQRNSSTMGHSRSHVLAVLDVSHKAFARHTRVTIAGQERRNARILGVVPFQVALVQTQAGFSVGAFTQRATPDGGCETVHAGAHGTETVQRWRTEAGDGTTSLVQESPRRTLRFVYRAGSDAELLRAEVWPFERSVPACVAHFSPALPDLRRPVAAAWRGTYVLDVNGQPSHGVGGILVETVGDVTRVDLVPERPRWTRDRPLRAEIRVTDQGARVDVRRLG